MARNFQWGGLGGKKADGRNWFSSGGRGTRVYGGEDEGLRVPEHHLGQLSQQARQRASAGATTRMNSSPSTTRPGTQSPSQPQRDLPGTRNFSLFGGVYTWSSAQEKKDLADPNFNGGAGSNVLKNAAVSKPAAVAAGGWDPSMTGEDYGSAAAEFSSVGAGNPALAATAAKSAAGITRTGESIGFVPGVTGRGIITSASSAGGLHGQPALPAGNYYVPAGEDSWTDPSKTIQFNKTGISYRPPDRAEPSYTSVSDQGALANAEKAAEVLRGSETMFTRRISEMRAKIKSDPTSLMSRATEGWYGIEASPTLSGDYFEAQKPGAKAEASATVDLWEQLGPISLARPKRR